MAFFGYLPKLKRSLGLPFGAHFLNDFSIKNVLSINKVSNFFPSQGAKQNVINGLIQTIDDIMNFKICIKSSSTAMADREKQGKTELQKFEYLENEKSFLVAVKSIFRNYLRAIIWRKNEIQRTRKLSAFGKHKLGSSIHIAKTAFTAEFLTVAKTLHLYKKREKHPWRRENVSEFVFRVF